MSPYNVSVVKGSMDATILGEGPHWDEKTNDVFYIDIIGQAIYRINAITGESGKLVLEDGKASLIIPVENQPNKYLITVGRDVRILDWDGKSSAPTSLKTIHTVDENIPSNALNDGKCDRLGRLWAGTMGPFTENVLVRNMGSMFSFHLDGSVVSQFDNIDVANGVAWTSDDKTLYFIDSMPYGVDAYDFDWPKGKLRSGIEGLPDGMTIDSNGNLWIAMFGSGTVAHVDPRTGQTLGQVKLPTPITTSVCFGGPNLEILYVTTAKITMAEEDILKDPTAGHLYQITNTGARGVPSFTYRGHV